MTDKIYTQHFRTKNSGSVTVCGQFSSVSEGNVAIFKIGVAFCSPAEKKFDKKKGRMIALGRLKAERMRGWSKITVENSDPRRVSEYMQRALSRLSDSADIRGASDLFVARWFKGFLDATAKKME